MSLAAPRPRGDGEGGRRRGDGHSSSQGIPTSLTLVLGMERGADCLWGDVGCVIGVQGSEERAAVVGVCVPGLGVRRCLLTAGVDRACQGYKMLLNKSP